MTTRDTTGELRRLERRMERQWRAMAYAERHGHPTATIERMYDAYVRTLDEYIAVARLRTGHEPVTRLAS